MTTKTLRRRFFSLAGRLTRSAPPHFASATGLALGNPVHSRAGSIASPAIACLTAPTAPDTSTRLPNRPTESHRPGPRLSSPCMLSRRPRPSAAAQDRHRRPQRQPKAATGPIYRNRARPSRPTASPLVPTPRPLRIGGFGAKPGWEWRLCKDCLGSGEAPKRMGATHWRKLIRCPLCLGAGWSQEPERPKSGEDPERPRRLSWQEELKDLDVSGLSDPPPPSRTPLAASSKGPAPKKSRPRRSLPRRNLGR